MKDKMQEALAAFQQDVIVSAEEKRTLSDAERRGIQSITSLMMLESCFKSFSSPDYTQAQVLEDLEHFTKPAQ